MSNHRVILMPSGRQGEITHGTTVLEAAHQLGVEIESICGGRQTCGKCLIVHERGTFPKHGITSAETRLTDPDVPEQAYAARHHINLDQYRLSCSACIKGDVLIYVPDKSLARKQVIRKEASDLTVDIQPSVRLLYVEVEPAELGSPGDWQRLKQALAEQWDIHDITIDPLVLRHLQKALRKGQWSVTVTLWHESEVIRIEPGYNESLYGLAVDVGSTTIAAYLCNLLTGDVIATETMMNPQVRYGEDLMSRISYGMMESQGVNRLHRSVIGALNELAENAAASIGISAHEITDSVLVGNTVMLNLLLGIDPVELGGAPFALATGEALDTTAQTLGLTALNKAAKVHILPSIAGHVGADNAAVLLSELPYLDDTVTLIVDIGTNAEILLATRDHILSASSPTGPAFEGAQITHGQRATQGAIERVRITESGVRYRVVGDQCWNNGLHDGETLGPTGICGSGIIETVAGLFLKGVINSSGRFNVEHPHPNLVIEGRQVKFVLVSASESATRQEIVITQNDVRAIQLAKAALYAGIRLLMDRMGVEQIARIKLSGAFGSYLDPLYAMILGLIPDCDLENVTTIGNAAGDGARIALLNVEQRRIVDDVVQRVDYVETAVAHDFQEHFVAAMSLPHTMDLFPHLDSILPHQPPPITKRRRRRRNLAKLKE